ncbi:hypothetical protein FC093_11850 [Ilyomonas limi]|uniref:Uncharacterized protein n=1 Tax=Ilyomonas limi TaxID=2575867 RepID=A0A4U3L257_9BACT|nr:hypothetical protein [Ilyomonas limi]TKK68319.1 hypothetical protein FC093_11850 [Ilyomonas limi]
MQKKIQGKAKEKSVSNTGFKWWIVASLITIFGAAFMLKSAAFDKEKAVRSYHTNNSYCGGDFALFVAMPLLNMIVK